MSRLLKYGIPISIFLIVVVYAAHSGEHRCYPGPESYQQECRDFTGVERLSRWWNPLTIAPEAWTAIFTFVLCAFTFGLWISTGLLWRESINATRVAESRLIAGNRPWIGISIESIGNIDVSNFPYTGKVVMAIRNAGNTPAADITYYIGIVDVGAGIAFDAFKDFLRQFNTEPATDTTADFLIGKDSVPIKRGFTITSLDGAPPRIGHLLCIARYRFTFGNRQPERYSAKLFEIFDNRNPAEKAANPQVIPKGKAKWRQYRMYSD